MCNLVCDFFFTEATNLTVNVKPQRYSEREKWAKVFLAEVKKVILRMITSRNFPFEL